jgi:hypothetical protein
MNAPTDRTRGTAGDLTEREAFEKSRAFYTPFTRAYVTRAADGTELVAFGEMTGTAIHHDVLDKLFEIEDYACPPTPMDAPEILDWIKTAPHGLQIRLNATLPDDLGETVGITEQYPPIEFTEARR